MIKADKDKLEIVGERDDVMTELIMTIKHLFKVEPVGTMVAVTIGLGKKDMLEDALKKSKEKKGDEEDED